MSTKTNIWVVAGHYDGDEVLMAQVEAADPDEAEAKFWDKVAKNLGLGPDEIPEDKYLDGFIRVEIP